MGTGIANGNLCILVSILVSRLVAEDLCDLSEQVTVGTPTHVLMGL